MRRGPGSATIGAMRAKRLDELPEPELQAMLLDGELWRPGGEGMPGWLSVAVPDGPPARAAALAAWCCLGDLVIGEAAMWLRLGGPPPPIIELAVGPGRARSDRSQEGVRRVERVYAPEDSEPLGRIRVLGPVRLVLDALLDPAGGAELARERLERLGCAPEAVAARAALLPRRPGSALARHRLAELGWRASGSVSRS
ncbi:hypothetical protein USB125703_01769 [Pseudoclavibacter triregionum]|nr:hypothetical protein USB125703_01769 [Pseudoclavibacter triregionum]